MVINSGFHFTSENIISEADTKMNVIIARKKIYKIAFSIMSIEK